MQGIGVSGVYILDGSGVKGLLKQRGLIFLFFIGLLAIMPWTAITNWIFFYLQSVHFLSVNETYRILFPALTALTLG